MKYLAGILGFFVAEERIKNVIEDTLEPQEKKDLPGGGATLTKHHNEGAVFDSLTGHKEAVHAASYGMFGAAAMLLLGTFLKEEGGMKKLGISMLFAGALSNTFDRIFRGYVIDYFIINIGKLKNIIFNLSDFMIFFGSFFGSFFYLLGSLADREKRSK